MSFTLHSKAEEKFNKDGFDLIGLITDMTEEPDPVITQKGSLGEKISLDWTDKLADAPTIASHTRNDEKINIYENYKGQSVGFNEANYPAFEKLVLGIYNIKAVSEKVTHQFLFDNVFSWAVRAHKEKRTDSNLIDFLKSEIAKVTSDYLYSFRILNLEIEKKFKLGHVEFEFLESSLFDKLEEGKSKEQSDALRKELQGNVYATCRINGVQRQKGLKIAFEECCKAMNVLKLFCATVGEPNRRTPFEIDSRVTTSEANEYIIRNPNISSDLKISWTSNSVPHKFTELTIDNILQGSKNFVTLIKIKEPNELQKILLNGIERFSELISNKDIHRRTADLFTIWESLLLKNDSVNIQDSLILYGRAIIGVKSDMIEGFSSFIMSMYDIRSQMVHHGNRKNIDLAKLQQLQINTIRLMECFIVHSERYATKQQLLQAVEAKIGMTVEKYTENRKSSA